MSVDFRIVVSSENTQYLAWQTQLFCFSALTRLKQAPIVIVHRSHQALRAEFCVLKELGCRILEAPSFRAHPKGTYLPRNGPGSMLTAAAITDLGSEYILFCEPDMLFMGQIEYEEGIAAEYYGYLRYEEPHVKAVAQKFGLGDRVDQLNLASRFGAPYLIPAKYLQPIASRWIEVLDSFETVEWIASMYAFGIALAIEGFQAKTTHIMDVNDIQQKPLSGRLIHYCQGDSAWNKRFFIRRSPFDVPDDALPSAAQGSILSELVTQIRQARQLLRPFNLLESARERSRMRFSWAEHAVDQIIAAMVSRFFRKV